MSDLHFSPRLFRVSKPRFWGKSGLVRRLMLLCLPFPLIILVALFLITHRNVEENLANAIAQNSYILSQSMGIALSQTLQETRNQIAVLATGSNSFEELRHRIWRRLETLNAMGDARFCEAAFLGLGQLSSKRFLWIQNKGKMRTIDPEQTEIQSTSPFHLPRRQPGEHEVVLSIPTEVSYSFSDPANKTPQTQVTLQLMRFTAPVTLSDGTFAGYLILSVNLAWLRDTISSCAIAMRKGEQTPLTFFVDNAGWMIFETGAQKENGHSRAAVIDTVRSGFQGDFGRAGYAPGFRPGAEYYSYWTMMNHIQKNEAGQFQTSRIPWNKDGIPVETVSYAPVTYMSGAEGRRDIVGGIVVLDTSFAAATQRSKLHSRYLVACAVAALLLSVSLFFIGMAIRKSLRTLGRDIAESTSYALAKPLPDRSAPKEVQELRESVNRLLEQLRNLEDERDMENTLASARIEVEEAHNMPTEIPVPPDGIIGVSLEMRNLRQNILQAAKVQADVLVMGETGTGKELISRAIHMHSANSEGPFMTINCGALDEGLLMDSLFGHVKGAYTEAREARKGAFLTAEGGTLMLDEIGNASPKVQQALLRALSDRRITPLGSDTSVPFNTRVIAATNADLREEICHHYPYHPLARTQDGHPLSCNVLPARGSRSGPFKQAHSSYEQGRPKPAHALPLARQCARAEQYHFPHCSLLRRRHHPAPSPASRSRLFPGRQEGQIAQWQVFQGPAAGRSWQEAGRKGYRQRTPGSSPNASTSPGSSPGIRFGSCETCSDQGCSRGSKP